MLQYNIRSKKASNWAAILFGLIFFTAGMFFLVKTVVPDLYDGWRMQSWRSTQAKLLAVDIDKSFSTDSDTQLATARYQYTVNGQQYVNDRVAIMDGADNIGDFQTKMQQHLRQAFRNHYPLEVWYNPDAPQDSVLSRNVRWGMIAFKMIFVVFFGGVGFMLIYFSLKKSNSSTVSSSVAAQSQPWLSRPEWKNGEIKSNAKVGMYGIWGFAIFWNAISFPAAIKIVPEILYKQNYNAVAGLIFPVVGIGLVYWAIRATRQWKRFGYTPLTMDPYPGSIGGQVGGTIKINTRYNPQQVFKVTLSCIYSYMSGSGKNRSRNERPRWQDEGYAQVSPAANSLNVSFCFDVPDNLPSSEEHDDSYHLWRLTLESEMDGPDLNRHFEIPVYQTAQQSNHLNIDSTEVLPTGVERITAESLLPLTQNGVIKQLNFPMFRKPAYSFSGIIFGGLFAGIGLFLWQQAKTDGAMLYFMAGIFSLIGFAVMFAGIYSMFNSISVKLDGISMHYRKKFLFFTLVDKVIPYQNISKVDSRVSSSSNRGGKHKINYTVFAQVNGKKYTLAEFIDSASKKDLVIAYFNEEFRR